MPGVQAQRRPQPIAVEVWKDASCGCCHDWIAHMQQHGFVVTAHDTGNNAVRARLGLAARYGSCHTALVGGYVGEGHVHADDVHRLLRDKPRALGLAVPGMPVGSPGMEGEPAERYDVIAWDGAGRRTVFLRFLGAQPLIAG